MNLQTFGKPAPPRSVGGTFCGWAAYYCRRYDRAITTLRHALELDPSFALASWFLVQSYLHAGELHNAAEEIEKSIRLSGAHPAALALQSVAYYALGRRKKAISESIVRHNL